MLSGKQGETRYAGESIYETDVFETPFKHLKPQLGVTIKEFNGN